MKKRPSLRTSLMSKEEMFLLQPRLNHLSNQLPPLTQPPRPPLPPQPPRSGVLKSPYHRPHPNQPRGPHKSTPPWNRRRQRKTWKSKRRKWREPLGQWGRKWKQNKGWTNTPVFSRVVAQRWCRLCCLPAWVESSRWGCKEAGPQEEKTDCTFSVAATTPPPHPRTVFLISASPLPALTLSKEILCLRIYNCERKKPLDLLHLQTWDDLIVCWVRQVKFIKSHKLITDQMNGNEWRYRFGGGLHTAVKTWSLACIISSEAVD